MTTQTIDRTAQRLEALKLGNELRLERYRIFRELAALPFIEARARAADLVCDPPRALHTLFVCDLLLHCRRIGPRVARTVLTRADVSPRRLVGKLTPRERLAIAGVLRSEDPIERHGEPL